MMTELFDKKFVHFMWEDELKDKKGFFADSIEALKDRVNTNYETCKVLNSANIHFPFHGFEADWKFFYYDPNYECKKAYAEGKTIQIKNYADSWLDCDDPEWIDDITYRIKLEEPEKSESMTYQELENENKLLKIKLDALFDGVPWKELLEKSEQIKKLQEQIEKMKCCRNCIHPKTPADNTCVDCDSKFSKWEMKE